MSFIHMPESGIGYYGYCPDEKRWGKPEVIAAAGIACARMLCRYGIEIGVGNCSLEHGGPVDPHKQHKLGVEIDFRPIRKDRAHDACYVTYPVYDRAAMVSFIVELRCAGFRQFLFNDDALINAGLTRHAAGHDNHLHAEYTPITS